MAFSISGNKVYIEGEDVDGNKKPIAIDSVGNMGIGLSKYGTEFFQTTATWASDTSGVFLNAPAAGERLYIHEIMISDTASFHRGKIFEGTTTGTRIQWRTIDAMLMRLEFGEYPWQLDTATALIIQSSLATSMTVFVKGHIR